MVCTLVTVFCIKLQQHEAFKCHGCFIIELFLVFFPLVTELVVGGIAVEAFICARIQRAIFFERQVTGVVFLKHLLSPIG